ncbi:hypothetical protein [Tateyamaria sp.]|uniref:hypothetical protein n=1 Tax=Tateyamaria sp. TaxID=1929288 RepID=UPI00329ACBB6
MSWIQTPIPSEDKRSRFRRFMDRLRSSGAAQSDAQSPLSWTVISLISAIVIAIASWLIITDALRFLNFEFNTGPIGISLVTGVLWFFWTLFKNPKTVVRRVFLGSCGLTIFALAMSLGGPSLLEILFGITLDLSIQWGVLIALIVLNALLFAAYIWSTRAEM